MSLARPDTHEITVISLLRSDRPGRWIRQSVSSWDTDRRRLSFKTNNNISEKYIYDQDVVVWLIQVSQFAQLCISTNGIA